VNITKGKFYFADNTRKITTIEQGDAVQLLNRPIFSG